MHRDFRDIDWSNEFAADPLIITGAGMLNEGDTVTVSFLAEMVQYYSDCDCYQARLVAKRQKPPRAKLLGGFWH